jgi:hypothetical chaperone protein
MASPLFLKTNRMSRYIYGVDFGTTNSALAIIDTTNNEIIKTFLDGSLIYFPVPRNTILGAPLKYYVGKEAVKKYVEEKMSGRFMKSLKRILPRDGFKETNVHGTNYTAEDLVSLILMELKKRADEYLGEKVNKAVFGRPVVFDKSKERDELAQKRLHKAASKAGFEQVFFQMEPIAAAFTYERAIKKSELVLVADFGGGTSDFTLMRLDPEKIKEANRTEDMIAKGGIYIGGDSFDSSMMWKKGTHHFGRGLTFKDFETTVEVPLRFFKSICSWEEMNFFNSIKMRNTLNKFYFLTKRNPKFKNLITLIEKNLGYHIFQSIEQAKIDLSSKDETVFYFKAHDIFIHEKISLTEFSNEIIADDISKIEEYLKTFLKDLNVETNEIDAIFMTGGTSLVKAVYQLIEDIFGADKIKSGDNFNSVANGLAYSYTLFSDEIS